MIRDLVLTNQVSKEYLLTPNTDYRAGNKEFNMNTFQDILEYLTQNNWCRLSSTIIQAIATFYKVFLK